MTRTRLAAVLATTVLACSPPGPRWPDGWAVPSAPTAIPGAIQLPRVQTFEVHGIPVALVENHRVPLVTIAIVHLAAGSRDDGDHPGIAALTSDLIGSASGLVTRLGPTGATLDADITSDATITTLHALTSLPTVGTTAIRPLDAALGVLADAVIHPQLDDDVVARARTTRAADIAERHARDRTVAAQAFDVLAFGAHPYARPAEGDPAVVASLTADDVRAFHAAHYGPKAARIVVAGDIDRAALTTVLEAAFAGWTGDAEVPAARLPVPEIELDTGDHPPVMIDPTAPPFGGADRRAQVRTIGHAGAKTTVVLAGARIDLPASDDARAAADVGNAIFGTGPTSRVTHRLHDELGLAPAASSSFWRGAWGASWTVAAAVPAERAAETVRELRALVSAFSATAPSQPEVDAARASLARAIAQHFDTDDGTARALARVVAQGRPADDLARELAALAHVTPESARAAFAQATHALRVVEVGPPLTAP